jgi:hypothetical protein
MTLRMTKWITLAALLWAVGCSKTEPETTAAPVKAGPPQVSEKEPNDDSKSAQSLTGASMQIHASFKPGDEDWYRLEPTGPVVARMEFSGVAGTETVFEVLDSDRNRLLKVTGGVAEPIVLPNMGCKAACYLRLAPSKKEATGDYTLTITTAPPAPRNEREPNSRYVDAQPLAVGAGIDGFISTGDDEDWFLIAAPAPAPTVAPVADAGLASTVDAGAAAPAAPTQMISLTLTSPPDVRMEVMIARQSDQAVLGVYKAADVGEDIKLPDLAFPVAPETALFLVVRSAWVSTPNGHPKRLSNTKAAYTLELKAVPAPTSVETEPNEDAAHATLMDLTRATTIQGYVSPKAESDWFTFKTAGPSIVRAEVTGIDNVKLALSVVDPAKKTDEKDNELARADVGDVKEPQILAGIAVPAGDNYIRVEGAWKKIDKKWVRDYANAEQPYTLTLTVDPDDGTWEREPNDKPATATVIEVGHDYKGFIQPRGDVDYWRLDLKQPANVAMTVSAVPKLDLKITVRDANKKGDDGEPAIVGMIDKNKVEAEERLVVPFEPGSYLIEIREKGKESNGSKPYTLSIK